MSLDTFILLSILVIILTLWIRWRKKKTKFFQRYGIPGPPSHFITGNLKDFMKTNSNCVQKWIEEYGKIFGFYLGGIPCIICADVNFIKLMQIKEFKKFANRNVILPDAGICDPIIYNSIGIKKNKEWKNLRSMISTSFSTSKIKLITTLVSKPINQFLMIIKEKKGEPFEITDMFSKLSFDLSCRTQFGIETNEQNKESNRFTKSLFSILKVDTNNILAAVSVLFPEFDPITNKLRAAVDFIKYKMELPCDRVVFETCRNILNSRKSSNVRSVDLLQNMIDAEDESLEEFKKLSDDCIIGNIVMFMLAGSEAVGNVSSWCLYYIAIHQDIQEKIREEIINNTKLHEEIKYSDLSNFKYMDQVLFETLRIYPKPQTAITRECEEDFNYKGIIIPKNVAVMIPIRTLHGDPVYWDNPDEFDPERFSPDNIGKIDNIIYQPFGAGPRNCIGSKLAQTIIKIILANLIRSYRFELHGDKNLEIIHHIFLSTAKNGIVLRAFPINSQSPNEL